MRWWALAAGCFVLGACGGSERRQLIENAVWSTNTSGPIEAGSLDTSVPARDFFVSELRRCGSRVRAVADEWAAAKGLRATGQRVTEPEYAQMAYTRAGLGGFIEIVYRLSGDRESARLQLVFVHHGQELDVSDEQLGSTGLLQRLRAAVACAD